MARVRWLALRSVKKRAVTRHCARLAATWSDRVGWRQPRARNAPTSATDSQPVRLAAGLPALRGHRPVLTDPMLRPDRPVGAADRKPKPTELPGNGPGNAARSAARLLTHRAPSSEVEEGVTQPPTLKGHRLAAGRAPGAGALAYQLARPCSAQGRNLAICTKFVEMVRMAH